MSPAALKGTGIGCFVVCVILLFVAWEQYQDNANKVTAMNQLIRTSPLGGMMNPMGKAGANQLEPGIPETTKYALFFAFLTGVGGVVCMSMKAKTGAGNPPGGTKSM